MVQPENGLQRWNCTEILYRQKSCWILYKQISNKNAFCHRMCSFLCRCYLLIWALLILFFMENWAIAFRSQLSQTLLVLSSVLRVERSTDQVIKPVNVEALSKWVGKIPADVVRDMAVIAPMLSRLGYDPHANPPNYGRPDPKVLDNTRRVSQDYNWS